MRKEDTYCLQGLHQPNTKLRWCMRIDNVSSASAGGIPARNAPPVGEQTSAGLVNPRNWRAPRGLVRHSLATSWVRGERFPSRRQSRFLRRSGCRT